MKLLIEIEVAGVGDDAFLGEVTVATILTDVCRALIKQGHAKKFAVEIGARLCADAIDARPCLTVDLNEVADRCGFPTDDERG